MARATEREIRFPFAGSDIALIGVVIVVVLFLFAGIKTVPQGYHWTVERFGRYTRTLDPGLKLIVPFIDRVGHKVNVMEQMLDVPSQEVITKDNAKVTVDGVLFFQVLDAARSSYEITRLDQSLMNLAMTNIRTVMGSMDLDALLSNRDTINESLLRVVDQAAAPWGIKVNRIEIKDIAPPADARRARSSRRFWRPRAARRPLSAMPRRANARPRPRPRRPRCCRPPSPAAMRSR